MTNKPASESHRLAAEIGLENPTPAVLEQLPLAAATARKHKSALQTFALVPADEPAVVFSAVGNGVK